jgi:hypothetical protein
MSVITKCLLPEVDKTLLRSVSATVMKTFLLRYPRRAIEQGVSEAVEAALVELASLGQRDARQLERYAEYHGRFFILSGRPARLSEPVP